MQRSRVSVCLLMLAALGAFVLAGCGSAAGPGDAAASTKPTTSSSPSPSDTQSRPAKPLPACSRIWIAGHKLPSSYHGCVRGGHEIASHHYACSSGQVLEAYGDHYFAARGGPVQRVSDLRHDKRYAQAVRSCTG
ncbi:hypothetical protein [Nocardioides terrisoli]|uniref:hypothetical protein n=1 Tax=Nocardioides terrisoli TaxID=3388267 RepID=UPI00287B77B2|nr:hypothetical protein [Nocardioides marmorisolisilvae]